MPNDKLPTPDRVLVVAAHPDDIEFGAAGTVARWIAEGTTVRYLLMTRGDKGSDDPSADPAALAELREGEQRAAAAEIGVAGVDFLDEPDGQVESSLRLRERVTYAIRSFQPEIVMTHLMEGIGLALDVPHDRMFVTDFGGSVYSARLDGSEKQMFLFAKGNLTGVTYAEIAAREK